MRVGVGVRVGAIESWRAELSATETEGGRDERMIERVRKRQKRMRVLFKGKGIEGYSISIQKAQNDAVLGEKKKKKKKKRDETAPF